MGVTLERVQNKFACIIGELCNEPVVLSQFAIWVDLRISEYKAKGAISLDCSGEEPDPVWMNGHRLPKRPERNHGRNSTPISDRRSRHSQNYAPDASIDTGFLNEGRLSPELLLIKEEPGGDNASVFPVSIHAHNALNPTPRKRPVSETISRSDDNFYHQDSSVAKLQRLSSAGDSTQHMGPDNTSNQSLMSIISGEQNQSSADISSSDIEVILDYENKSTSHPSSQHHDQQNSSIPSQPTASSSHDNNESFHGESSNASVGLADTGHKRETTKDHIRENRLVLALRNGAVVSEIRADVKSRFTNVEDISEANLRNMIAAATTLGCWLAVVKNETRQVETMLPVELDAYLMEFFSELKRRDGEEYDPVGFGNFRWALDSYLNRKGYAYSIRSSPEFINSRVSFNVKRKSLVLIDKQRERLIRQRRFDNRQVFNYQLLDPSFVQGNDGISNFKQMEIRNDYAMEKKPYIESEKT